jgi:hypothetical protein
MAAPAARAPPVGAFRPRVRAPPRRALRASPTPGRGGGGPAGRATRAQPPPRATAPSSASDDGDAAVLARVAATSTTAVDAWAALAAAGAAPADESGVVAVLDALLAAGNADAAIAVHAAASTAPAAATMGLAGSWPRCGPRAASSLVVGLARLLRPDDAVRVLDSLRTRPGPPGAGAVPFGVVVRSPLPRSALAGDRPPLAVVRPGDGARLVACPECRYEFELWSGTVSRAASEPAARAGAASRAFAALTRSPPPAAVHELDVVTPGGESRPFRLATADPAAPAVVGDSVTLTCAPRAGAAARSPRRAGPLPPTPPDTAPGDAMTVTNHRTGAVVDALRALPRGAATAGPAAWLAPAAAVALAGDAASSLLNPSLPLLLAGGAAAAVGAAALGARVVVPALRRLPTASVGAEASRSALLTRHAAATGAAAAAAAAGAAHAASLARARALLAKMGALASAGEYDARSDGVQAAAAALEARLVAAVELVDG